LYELIVLALLVRFPAHGYLIAHIINDIIGPYARISNGRLYPLLAKLEENKLVELNEKAGQEQHGERNLRCYRITKAGRKRLHSLLMDTTSNPGEYQRIFLQKVPVLYLLKPAERLYLIDHYLNYCQAHVLHLTAEAEDLAGSNYTGYKNARISMTATLDVARHMANQWRLEVDWAQHLREQELAHQEGADEQNDQLLVE
jgi:DNA-binding PadR family transcriptional regulator